MTSQLILSRHAESHFNVRRLVNGDPSVSCPLTSTGRRQAASLGAQLRDVPLDLCATSEFPRTRETAEIALQGRGVRLVVVPELNDPPMGDFEGRPLDEYVAWLQTNEWDATPAGGESQIASLDRYCRAYEKLLDRHEPSLLVVCHTFPVAFALCAADPECPELLREYPPVPHAVPHRVLVVDLRTGLARVRTQLQRLRATAGTALPGGASWEARTPDGRLPPARP